MDSLAATGEQVSAALMALALQNLGCPARSFTAHQVKITTDGRFNAAAFGLSTRSRCSIA
jgi:aspartate kinase